LAEQSDVDDLVALLERLAMVALGSDLPRRPCYTQARLLRERYGFSGELAPPARCCATSSCSCCVRFDAFEVKKDSDAKLCQYDEALFFYQPTGDGGSRAAPADAVAPFGECGRACSRTSGVATQRRFAAGEELDRALREHRAEVIAAR